MDQVKQERKKELHNKIVGKFKVGVMERIVEVGGAGDGGCGSW